MAGSGLKATEIDLHRSVADYLNWMVLPPAVWTTFPAGWTAMRPGAAGRLRGCGLKAGMPDILVFYNGSTLGIELKALGGKPTPVQRDMLGKLYTAGVKVHVAHSIDDVHAHLVNHGIPLRKSSYGNQASEGRRPQESAQGAARPA